MLKVASIRTTIFTLLLVTLTGCAQPGEFAARQRRGRQPTIEQFIKIRWPSSATLATGGRFYYIDLVDGVRQLHRRGPDAHEGAAITDFGDGIGG